MRQKLIPGRLTPGRPIPGRRRFLLSSAAAAMSLAAGSRVLSQDPAARQAEGRTTVDPAVAGKWQLGCFTRPFNDFLFTEALDGIATAGYQSVGLMTVRLPEGAFTLADATPQQAAEVARMAEDRGLSVAVTYYGGPPVSQSLEAGVAAMRQLIDNCAAARCAAIVMGGTTKAELYDDYYRAIAQLCDYAVQRGVALTLKPHGGLNATGPQCRRAIQRVGHPAFKLWYDPGNIFYYSDGQLDPVDDAATVDGLVTGMCVKDFQPPKDVAINPGSGKVDFPGVFKTLAAGGFTSGPLIVETLAPGDLQSTVANARRTRERLAQWLPQA